MEQSKMLGDIFLFEGTDAEKLFDKYSVRDRLVYRTYKSQETIHTAESAAGVGMILCGGAVIVSGEGAHASPLRYLFAGDVFGAASLFCKSRLYLTTVRALGECSVAFIPSELVALLCKSENTVAMNYIRFLSGRIAFLNSKLSAFAAGSADARLAVYLSELFGGEKTVSLSLSLTELADSLGVGRASLYRSLDRMCSENIISRDRKKLTLLDAERLRLMINK